MEIGKQMEDNFIKKLPNGFYAPISTPIKTMILLQKGLKIRGKTVHVDLETIFLRVLTISQQWDFDMSSLFA